MTVENTSKPKGRLTKEQSGLLADLIMDAGIAEDVLALLATTGDLEVNSDANKLIDLQEAVSSTIDDLRNLGGLSDASHELTWDGDIKAFPALDGLISIARMQQKLASNALNRLELAMRNT